MIERVHSSTSLHDSEKPELCSDGKHDMWRVVKCDGSKFDTVECSRCGKQKTVACTFDEDYS
jgi:Neuraminidase (sialidase)